MKHLPILEASKIVVPKAEFDEIKALAKKQIAGDKKDKKLALDNKKLQAANQQLKAFKEKVLRFTEKFGLKQQFDKFMKGNVEKER